MKYRTVARFLPNKGNVKDRPKEFLNYAFSPYSRNVEFYNDLLQSRQGLTKFNTTALPDRVQKIDQYWRTDSTWFLIFATKRDICKYDFSNSRFDFLTPQYTTGTITIDSGDLTTVEGAGVDWVTAGIKEGDFIKIGSGDAHTGSTWYEIDSITDLDTLVLKTNGTACAGSDYIIRKTFSGSDTIMWDSDSFTDANYGTIWVGTNGVDTPVRYSGSGLATAIAGLEHTAARYVKAYKDRLHWFWTVEGGVNCYQRTRWSAVADCEDNSASDFHDFVDENDSITGATKFRDYLIVMKEYEAYVGRYVGGEYIFDYEKNDVCIGCKSNLSIIVNENIIYYYAPDKKIHATNLVEDKSLTDDIFSETKEFDPNLEVTIVGHKFTQKNQIRWFCPYSSTDYHNYTIVLDYKDNILQIWEYESEQACCSIGEYVNIEDLYVDDPVWGELYVDEVEGFWDDKIFLDNAPILIYGGYDGYIRIADLGNDDDGNSFTRTFRTIRDNMEKPDTIKRLWKQEFWFEANNSGDNSVEISMRKDDKLTKETTTKTISLVDSTKDIIKEKITWDKKARNFEVEITATNFFALLGYINYIFDRDK